MTIRTLLVSAAALMCVVPVGAQQPEQPPAQMAPKKLVTPISRADLADVYLRFERALNQHPPKDATAINKAFDGATLQFFSGTFGDTARTICQLTDGLLYGDAVTSNRAFASSLKVSIVPAVLRLDEPAPPAIRVEPMYAAQAVGAVSIKIVGADGRIVLERPVTEPRALIAADPGAFRVGTYRVQVFAGDEGLFSTRFVVTDRSLNVVRDELLKKLDSAAKATAELDQAIGACRSRINLLTDLPSADNSAEFLSDPTELRALTTAEVEAILSGKDPYHDRRGDYWRTISLKGAEVPCRMYAPASLPKSGAPVIIAMHGMGGDEAMFMDGYGAGEMKRIAEKRGFLLICPRTEFMTGNPLALEQVIAAAGYCYDIDRSRVYLLGHSLGAMTAGGLSAQRPDKVAAACLIAGTGRFSKGKPVPPTLVISGEFDPLMRADQVRAGVKQGVDAGMPVELRLIPGRGHTLIVGEQLDSAAEWLLKHKK